MEAFKYRKISGLTKENANRLLKFIRGSRRARPGTGSKEYVAEPDW
jgi:hypothetical protein